jgi:ABC-type glycerol-3-phosphate transport system permease component
MTSTSLTLAAAAGAGAAAFLHGTAAAWPSAGLAAALSLSLAAPLAVALGRLRFEGRAMFFALLVVASATAPALLRHAAAPATDLATRLALGVPLATWVIYLAARALPAHLEDSAALDGATRLDVWIPLLRPAVLAAAALVFLYCAFDLGPR